MPRLRTGGAEAAVSEAFGGGGRWGEAGRRTGRRGHGGVCGAKSACARHLCGEGGRVSKRQNRERGRKRRTLVRHTLQQADVEVHPAGGAAARVSGSRGGGGAAGRRPAATHSSHSTVCERGRKRAQFGAAARRGDATLTRCGSVRRHRSCLGREEERGVRRWARCGMASQIPQAARFTS